MVSNPPAITGGAKLKTALRPGPETNGICAARALRSIDQPAIKSDIKPSASQIASHELKVDCRAENTRDEGSDTDRYFTETGNTGEGRGAFHGFANVAKIVHGAVVEWDEPDRFHDEDVTGDAKLFARQSHRYTD